MGVARTLLLGSAAVLLGGAVLLVRGQRRRKPLAAAVCVLSSEHATPDANAADTKHAAPDADAAVHGVVRITQYGPWLIFGGYTLVAGSISGLSPGAHGLHIREWGDITCGAASTGGHYNPGQCAHGGPEDRVRHAGDLGNVWAAAEGDGSVARVRIYLQDDSLLAGPRAVLGRALVVTACADDCGRGDNSEPWPSTTQGRTSKTTGNAGDGVACGVIGWAQ
jgi:Cu-Zn family superoxide dismutase